MTTTGSITLRVSNLTESNAGISKSRTIYFEVEDTGIGIARDELSSLFEPFIQTASGLKSHEGTGLGLAISQKHIQLMGSNISVSSHLDRGSSFKFELQVETIDSLPVVLNSRKRRIIGLAPNQANYRILIVEDKWENSLFLIILLDPLGFTVKVAENGKDGIRLWKSWKPDLILMDIQMPMMNGLEATTYIRTHSRNREIVIASTASSFEQKRAEALEQGCDDFISKPFQEEALLEMIGQYLKADYLYQESQISQKQSEAYGKIPQATMAEINSQLAHMPLDWITQVNYYAKAADREQISLLLEEIPEKNFSVADAIAKIIDNFEFDKIIQMTQNFLSQE